MSKIARTRKPSALDQPFHRHFAPGNIRLDQKPIAFRLPKHLNLRRFHQQPNPPHRLRKFIRDYSLVSRPGSRKARAASPRKEISPAQAHRPDRSEIANEKKSGTRTPAARSVSRCRNLLRQISAADGEFPAMPSASAAYAAVTVGRSPSASTASTALSPAVTSLKVRAISCAASRGFSKCNASAASPQGSSSCGSDQFQTAHLLPASPPPPQIRESDNQACWPVSAPVSNVSHCHVPCYLHPSRQSLSIQRQVSFLMTFDIRSRHSSCGVRRLAAAFISPGSPGRFGSSERVA